MKKMENEKQFIYKMSRDQYDRCFTSEKYFYSYNPDTDEVCISVSLSERLKIISKMKKFKVKKVLVDTISPENEDEKELEDAPEWNTSDAHVLHSY